MKNLSIVEEYTLLTFNDKGVFTGTSFNYSAICLIVAAISDMGLNDVIKIDEKQNLYLVNDLPENLDFLRPLYDYMKEKEPANIKKVVQAYSMGYPKRFKELLSSISNSLNEKYLVDKDEKSGILGDKILYYPNKKAVESIVQQIRVEVLEEGEVSEETLLLSSILDRGKQLNQFFSKYEAKTIKDKLEKLRKTEASELANTMIKEFDTLIILLIASL